MKVSKKNNINAVIRNKIRRRFKNLLFNFIKQKPELHGNKFLIIPKKSILFVQYANLKKELNNINFTKNTNS